MPSYFLQDLTSPQVKAAIKKQTILLLPLGQTEQHGPHLQIGCDTIIAQEVAEGIAQRVNPKIPALVMPAIPYAYVPKAVRQWPGTFRIRWDVMINFIADVCASAAEMGFERIVVVSTHGPHGDIARVAARDVFDRTGVGIVVTQPHTIVGPRYKAIRKSKLGGTSHACEYETSLLIHFGYPIDLKGLDDRDRVKVCNEWVAGDMLNGSGRVSWSTWALQLSKTGVYGDASCSSAQTGKATFEAIIDEYARFLDFYRKQKLPKQTFKRYPQAW